MLFQSVSGSSLGDKLLSLLANGSMKRNEFTNHISRPSGEIEAELNKLLEAGRVMKAKEKRSGAGRPAEVWQLVDEGGAQ
jgi:predicted ArsR family transcriptional regulator